MKNKKLLTLLTTVCLLALSACGTGTVEVTDPSSSTSGQKETVVTQKAEATEAPAESGNKTADPIATPTTVPATPTPTEVPATPTPTETPTPTPVPGPEVGGFITLGQYEQDNNLENGAESIEWLVLAIESDRMLVISKYGLDMQAFHTEAEEITWENCTLRKWLNEEFYNKAFSEDDKTKILTVTLENPDTDGFYLSDYVKVGFGRDYSSVIEKYAAKGGNPTEDRLFCLSWAEALEYFDSNESRICEYTAYAWSKTGRTIEGWMLRSPLAKYCIQLVDNGGFIPTGAVRHLADDLLTIRPAMWISTK